MRIATFLLVLCGSLAADVVVLKDGRKFGGKVTRKPGHVEVKGDDGLRTFLKDEVERVVTDPKELLGDSAKLFEEAKKDFLAAMEIKDVAQSNPKLKAAIAKLMKARQAYAGTRELFPGNKHSDLDTKLVQVMQLMRMARGSLGSEIARKPGPRPAPVPAPAPPPLPPTAAPAPRPVVPPPINTSTIPLDEAFEILVDRAKRTDAAQRTVARDSFRDRRTTFMPGPDLATAAMIFLSGPEPEGALQDYFGKWLKEPGKLTPAAHLEAAKFLADALPAAKKTGASAAEAVKLFAMGHLAHATSGPAAEKAASALDMQVKDGMTGTAEGLAALDLAHWIASGDYDLAVLAYAREFRSVADTPVVRFLKAYALLLEAQERKKGYKKSAAALLAVRPRETAFREHAAALAKSISNVAVCSYCGGKAKVRCTSCHGKKEVRIDCSRCKGVGAVRVGGLRPCRSCKGRGYLKLLRCRKCKDGFPVCRVCDHKPRTPPAIEDIFLADRCKPCDGSGSAFRRIAVPCLSCKGLGQKLTPRADPGKILP